MQLELLKIYSFNPTESDLVEIKHLLANYFAEKLNYKIDKAVEKKGLTQNDFDNWLNEEQQ